MLSQLGNLIGSTVGFMARGRGAVSTTSQFELLSAIDVNFSSQQREFMQQYIQHECSPDPAEPILVKQILQAEPQSTIAFTRQQLIDDKTWQQHPHVINHRHPANLDQFVYAIRLLPRKGDFDWIAFYRPRLAEPYTDLDRDLLQLFWSEAEWLFPNGPTNDYECLASVAPRTAGAVTYMTADGSKPLPRRLEQLLHLVHQGYSTADIATQMRISRHTVYDHFKRLYRHFDVNSRAELMARTSSPQTPPADNDNAT